MENAAASGRHGCSSRIPQCRRIVVGIVVVVVVGGHRRRRSRVPVGVAQTVIQAGLPPASNRLDKPSQEREREKNEIIKFTVSTDEIRNENNQTQNVTEMLRRRRRNSLSWSYRPLEPTSWAAVGYSPDPMTFAVCTTDQIKN